MYNIYYATGGDIGTPELKNGCSAGYLPRQQFFRKTSELFYYFKKNM
jgi:hypothetical protein